MSAKLLPAQSPPKGATFVKAVVSPLTLKSAVVVLAYPNDLNVAMTASPPAAIVTTHGPVPAQPPPDHPAK